MSGPSTASAQTPTTLPVPAGNGGGDGQVDYSMRISRLTVDKLGVKLYDRASAVLAELIANAYDADAKQVTVAAPMNQYLASRAGGELTDKGFTISVKDDGIGMTPREVQDFFLVIGAERRTDKRRGGESRELKRKVMGRKGVGKLAPYGICKIIEVLSAGGEPISRTGSDGETEHGYLTSHILLNYDEIVAIGDEPDERYLPDRGNFDNSLSPTRGTTITLRNFNYRRVPTLQVLDRQIAQRFGIRSHDWEVRLEDNTAAKSKPHIVGEFAVEVMPNTRLSFGEGKVLAPDGTAREDLRPGFDHDGRFYDVNGWVAYSKEPYKDDLMAGVRIYCHGKIAAQTSIFNRRAGFTGEHNVRSYLVGELHADWLDEQEDLIQTDRRDILWSHDLATEFEAWGQRIVQVIGTLARDPMRKATLQMFLETGHVEERIKQTFPGDEQKEIRDHAFEIARTFGRTMSRPDAQDVTIVDDFVDLSITLAPHITLDDMMRRAADEADAPVGVLSAFLRTARLAELSSFGRIAKDRLAVIERLEEIKDHPDTIEDDLQTLIEEAPWLINPEWAPVTSNQWLATLRREFEKHYESATGEGLQLTDFKNPKKRPDFVLTSQQGRVQIVEIKKPKHALTNDEMGRIVSYYDNMESFLKADGNKEFREQFPDFHITLVCDELALHGSHQHALEGWLHNNRLTQLTWSAFLAKTRQMHRDFREEADRQRQLLASSENAGRDDAPWN